LLVNRRTTVCLGLTEAEAEACGRNRADGTLHTPGRGELRDELIAAGFVAGTAPSTPSQRTAWWAAVRRAVSTLELRTAHADLVARMVYRRGVRWMFHPVATVAQALLAVAGVLAVAHAVINAHTVELRVHPAQVPVVIALSVVSIVVHELCHALVVVHGGGRVDAAGVRIYLGTPTFFVESIDAQLLSRRQRIVQAAAGPWSEWLVTSVAAIWLWSSEPTLIAPALLARFVLLNSANVLSNLLPFVKLDGSWILADAIGEPDLSQQAQGAIRRMTVALILRQPVAQRDRRYALYSAVNAAVAVVLLAASGWVWWQLFAGIVATLANAGSFGWLILTSLAAILGRPVMVASLPRLIAGIETVNEIAAAMTFRSQFVWRIAAVRALTQSEPSIAALDDQRLSVLTGLLTTTPTAGETRGHLRVEVHRRHVLCLRTSTAYLELGAVADVRSSSALA
jgi:hypothetical protein